MIFESDARETAVRELEQAPGFADLPERLRVDLVRAAMRCYLSGVEGAREHINLWRVRAEDPVAAFELMRARQKHPVVYSEDIEQVLYDLVEEHRDSSPHMRS